MLDVGDKLDELYAAASASAARGVRPAGPHTEDAVLGLVRLGYVRGEAERAVRAVLDNGGGVPPAGVPELVRAALAQMAGR